jgi:adenylate cyclase
MSASVLLIDSDAHAAQQLAAELRNHGFGPVECVGGGLAVRAALARMTPDVIVFGYHFDRPDELLGCESAMAAAPSARVLALGTVGPAVRFLRQWSRDHGLIDVVVERPLSDGQLALAVRELARTARMERELQQRSDKLAALVPEGALASLESDDGEGELFEAVVLFTDMRSSTELIARTAPRDFFALLNRSLSEQSRIVRLHQGQVVKYTGDGLMAIFRGMGRSQLALRAASALAAHNVADVATFGVGLASGLVLAGLVGDSQLAGERQQYDVIGATVHLAARLCAQAEAGEVMLPRSLLRASRVAAPSEDRGLLQVRGFGEPVDCVALTNPRNENDEIPLRRNPALASAGPGADVPVRLPGAGLSRHLRTA